MSRLDDLLLQKASLEAEGIEDHPYLDGQIDRHGDKPHEKCAYEAGWDFSLPASEQTAHATEWGEGYEDESERLYLERRITELASSARRMRKEESK